MFRFFILPLLCLAFITCAFPQQKAQENVEVKVDKPSSDIMKLDELTMLLKQARQSGTTLKGYGKTVFFGTKPEKFDIEVIDIKEDFVGEGYDVIFFRFDSPYIKREDSSIVHGMSGSPLYVRDRIIGALAYGWGWGRVNNTVGYATPIEYMIQEMETGAIKPSSGHSVKFSSKSDAGLKSFVPLYFSRAISSSFRKKIDKLNEMFPDNPFNGFEFIGSAASSKIMDDQANTDLEPGSVVGVEFVGGDLSLGGIGTVTYVKGNKISAFGHPMYKFGSQYKFPLTTGSISGIIALFPTCWKEGSATKDVGVLDFDGNASISGTMGKVAERIPAKVNLTNKMTGQSKEVNLKIAKAREFIPNILWMAFSEVQGNMLTSTATPLLLRGNVSGKLSDGNEFSFMFEEASRGGDYYNFDLYRNLSMIAVNPYKQVDFESIQVSGEFIPNLKFACIKSVWTDKSEIQSLEEPVVLKVVLSVSEKPQDCPRCSGGYFKSDVDMAGVKPVTYVDSFNQGCTLTECCGGENSKKELKEFKLILPSEVKSGDIVTITVGSGQSVVPQMIPHADLKGLVDNFGKRYKTTDLVIRISTQGKVYYYRGKELTNLPRSELAKMIGEVTVWEQQKFVDKVEDVPYILSHSWNLTVQVK